MWDFRTFSLVSLLSNVFICREEVATCIWKPSSFGEFFTNSFLRGLEVVLDAKATCSLVWIGLAPPRVEVFCWLTVLGKVATTDVFRRRVISFEVILDSCLLSETFRQSIDHLFMHCDFSYHM